MVKLSKQVSVTGASVITVNGKEEQVAFMNATIPAVGTPNIGRAIQNVELFNANKDKIMQDFSEFDEYIYSLFPNGDAEKN